MKSLYIGLMSGTSMDGIDAGLFEIKSRSCVVKATLKSKYPPDLRRALLAASRNPETCTVDTLGHLDNWVGECFMRAAEQLIADNQVDKSRIRAIGSHGQTIRHQPRTVRPFTMQIGDPNLIAAGTEITTVADFRRRDLALGGEGAPLATAFHKWLLSDRNENRVVLNIGGIANITVLPAGNDAVSGFDTGPGNTLLDAWIQLGKNEDFDAGGAWADSGCVAQPLLDTLLGDSYFASQPPKSTGFEYFNLTWLRQAMSQLPDSQRLPAEDIQATLAVLTARSIAHAVRQHAPATRRVLVCNNKIPHFNLTWLRQAMSQLPDSQRLPAEDIQATLAVLTARSIANAVRQHAPATRRILVCGGGVHNTGLMRLLKEELAPIDIDSTASAGMDPDWVEAATFAWLAKRCLDHKTGNLPGVTGAARETILGGVYASVPD